jgi:hypothetical protein
MNKCFNPETCYLDSIKCADCGWSKEPLPTPTPIDEELREKLKVLKSPCCTDCPEKNCDYKQDEMLCPEMIRQILALLPKGVELAEDQSLPENPYIYAEEVSECGLNHEGERHLAFEVARKAYTGFRRIK